MTAKKDDKNFQSEELMKDLYVPSETERKRVVIYYFIIGILFALSNDSLSKYEYYHLKQAIGWSIVFFAVFSFLIIVIWVPVIVIIPWLLMMILLWIWVFFVIQARQWKYTVEISWKERVFLPIFAWLWNWLLELFDKRFEDRDKK